MRYFFTTKLWIALSSLVGVCVALVVVLGLVNNSGSSNSSNLRRVDLVAAITVADVGEGWQVVNETTVGDISITLDDGRVLRIVDGTPAESACPLPITAYSCVVLADTLGAGVLWFSFVPADVTNGKETLILPSLVDMLDAGELGVLSNGWVVPLATPTLRNCESETSSLRDFINKFPEGSSISQLNLHQDQITEVFCS